MIKLALLSAACGAIFSQAAVAQNATTVPVGAMTVNIRGGNMTAPTTQFLGFGLATFTAFQSPVVSTSEVSSPTGNVTRLNLSVGSFNPSVLGGAGGAGSHYVEIVGGSSDGFISHVGTSVPDAIVIQDLIGSISGTFSVRVRPFLTVSQAFGVTNEAGFLGGASSSSADIIRILLPGASPIEVFYSTSAGAWQTVLGQSANSQPIYPDGGLEIVRRGASPLTFTVLGEVKTGSTTLIVEGGTGDIRSNFQNLYPLASVRLKDLSLYSGNATTGVKEGTSVANADFLTIEDTTTGVRTQFFVDSASKRWRTGFTDASLVQIPENASVSLTRRDGSAFSWRIPQPSMALGTDPLPLTLVAAASRKTHGSAGTWDVNLPLTTGPLVGIEPRATGTSGNHTIVLTFDGASSSNPITAASASVIGGTATVASTQFNGNEVLVNLSGAANQQTVTVAVSGIVSQNGQTAQPLQVGMGLLIADINYSRQVNAGDIGINRSLSLSPINFANFRADLNASGGINAGDIGIARSRSLQSIP